MDKLLPNLEVLNIQHSLLKNDEMPSLEKLWSVMIHSILQEKENEAQGKWFSSAQNSTTLDLDKFEEREVDEDAINAFAQRL